MTRMSALQFALVRLVGERGNAAGGGDLPAVRPLVEEVAVAIRERGDRARDLHARVHDTDALRQLERQDRLPARLLLLLLELGGGLLAQLVARGPPVVGLERGVEGLGDRRGVPL